MLPLPNQPLKSRFSGPYKVLKRTSDVNYVLATPDRRKKKLLVHVNSLKSYHTRDSQTGDAAVSGCTKDVAMVVPCSPYFRENEHCCNGRSQLN